MKIEIQKVYSVEDTEANEEKLYVFGENNRQQWTSSRGGGQAIIRGLDNAFGFCTLNAIGDFWSDNEFSQNVISIETDILDLKKLSKGYETIVFPYSGLGTGRAMMQKACPKTFLYLTQRLLEEFNFNNIENLISEPF